MKIILLILLIFTGCASSKSCYNKIGIEKEQCENFKKIHKNDWRYENDPFINENFRR